MPIAASLAEADSLNHDVRLPQAIVVLQNGKVHPLERATPSSESRRVCS